MPREDSVIWRVIQDNQRVARDVGQQLLGEPFGEEVMVSFGRDSPLFSWCFFGKVNSLPTPQEKDQPLSLARQRYLRKSFVPITIDDYDSPPYVLWYDRM